MVIVNKEPHSKKVPLLLFQFPSPPIWNNWLSHLLNLYSFVITSHLNLFSSFSPLLSSTSSLFFSSLSLSLSLSQGHMKQKNGGWQHGGNLFQGPFWLELGQISDSGACFDQNQPEFAWKKKRLTNWRIRACWVRVRVRWPWSRTLAS